MSMSKQAMVKRLEAHSRIYEGDAQYWAGHGNIAMYEFSRGKAEAYATAASWIEEAMA